MSLVTLEQAVASLQQGDVVALPTETVYGLAARIDSESALHKIFSVKQRPFFDPLIVHVPEVQAARALCSQWPEIYDLLTQAFWPGPLTLIAPKSAAVSSLITSGLDTVAVRCPAHPLMLQVLQKLGVPLAAPSANRFGRTSPTTAQHVETEFLSQVQVLDGGPCQVGVESTVLSAQKQDGGWNLSLLRPGGVTREQLRTVLDGAGVTYQIQREINSVASPGHLKAHYQPVSPVILLREKSWSSELQREVERQLGRPLKGAQELKLPATPQEAARRLYEMFRTLSTDSDHALWIRLDRNHESEAWETVQDRIERAACVHL